MPNLDHFLAGQQQYFSTAYDQFVSFGGPCVYFHHECLREGARDFLSHRHLEMLYATLTAWGMHRMGDSDTTKTKLTDWQQFRGSILATERSLRDLRELRMLDMSESEYSTEIKNLKPVYESLRLSASAATVVVNSKALHHMLPQFIPPIDRQYTIRFFRDPPERWRDSKGKFRLISLPSSLDAQFRLFHGTCIALKRLADRVDRALLEKELAEHGIATPKAIDNAIVNFVRIIAGAKPPAV